MFQGKSSEKPTKTLPYQQFAQYQDNQQGHRDDIYCTFSKEDRLIFLGPSINYLRGGVKKEKPENLGHVPIRVDPRFRLDISYKGNIANYTIK